MRVNMEGCERFRGEGPTERWGPHAPGNLCHPAFAMTGALAWQAKKIINKKKIFWFGGRSHGGLPRVSLLCGVCLLFRSPFIIIT